MWLAGWLAGGRCGDQRPWRTVPGRLLAPMRAALLFPFLATTIAPLPLAQWKSLGRAYSAAPFYLACLRLLAKVITLTRFPLT